MNGARLTLLLVLTPLAAPLAAQGIDKEDPCYELLTGAPLWSGPPWPQDGQTLRTLIPRIPAVWGNRDALQNYVNTLAGVVNRFPDAAMTLDEKYPYFSQGWDAMSMLAVSKCLPWLEGLITRLESRLAELGSSSATVGAAMGAARPGGKDLRFDHMRKKLHEMALVLDQMHKRPLSPGRRP